ncbi:MAG TPA: DUF6282 family protein [Chloroflexota bacterium]|nr:DUF6282 family protein [Chloroflexota bacterium]
MNLSGIVDLHLHSAPDVRARSLDDLTAAKAARQHGMAGVLLKNHHAPTAARAALAQLHAPGAPIYGGVVLNTYVGGLNPDAVHAMAALGGRAVWLPTFTAANHLRHEGTLEASGIRLLDREGRPEAALRRVLEAVAERDLLLCTGHISVAEVLAVVPAAREVAIKRILIQHVEHKVTGLTHDQQRWLADQGVFLERCYGQPQLQGAHAPNFDLNVEAIRAVGFESTVLASDLGQPDNPSWPEGYATYLQQYLDAGFPESAMDVMCRRNPAWLLGLS